METVKLEALGRNDVTCASCAMQFSMECGLDANTSELAHCIAEFRERYASLDREIAEEEQKKSQIQADIQILTKRLVTINDALANKIEERQEYATVVRETEAAYAKILESSQTLLAVVKRETATLKHKRQPT